MKTTLNSCLIATAGLALSARSQLQRLHALLGCSPAVGERVTGNSLYERLPVPYVFRPLMSVADASVAAVTIFTRIFLGCLLFAVWGTYTMFAWSSIPSHFWRTTAMLPLAILFVFLLGLLMLGISAASSYVTKRALGFRLRTL